MRYNVKNKLNELFEKSRRRLSLLTQVTALQWCCRQKLFVFKMAACSWLLHQVGNSCSSDSDDESWKKKNWWEVKHIFLIIFTSSSIWMMCSFCFSVYVVCMYVLSFRFVWNSCQKCVYFLDPLPPTTNAPNAITIHHHTMLLLVMESKKPNFGMSVNWQTEYRFW